MTVPIALGAIRALGGSILANQERQRKKGVIGRAAKLGQERLNLEQGDTRQSVAEAMTARGLSGVSAGAPVRATESYSHGPGTETAVDVGQAHDLGSQSRLDLRREQQLQQSGLAQQVNNAYGDVNAEATQGIINSIGAGVSTALGAQGALNDVAGAKAASAAADAISPQAPSVRGAFGLHPITAQPITMGAEPGVASLENVNFNKFAGGGAP